MCGITGIYSFKSKDDIKEIGNKCFKKLVHRGPDEQKEITVNKNVYLGFNRLSINGVNSESGQPFENDDCIVICNGEIYNYLELAKEHKIELNTNSDCEILPHLFSKLGIDFIKLLDAEFALLLYNKKKDVFYAARDHIGIRPLFVGELDTNTVMFASEARALSEHCTKIRQFKPGCYSSSGTGLFNEIEYYDYLDCINPEFKHHSYDDVCKNVHDILVKSVKDRLISDRPIGAFLSGGLDSSIVVAILAKYVPDLNVFTIGFKDSPDIVAAKLVAKHCNIKNHHVVEYTPSDGIGSLKPVCESLESYDITTMRASTPQWLLSKYIKEETEIRVLFSGECIDEICGYYFLGFCKSDKEFTKYTKKMLKELYLFDLLRTDRTTAAHGLEVRVPFASKAFLNYLMNINPMFKMFTPKELEKKILRDAFKNYLPSEIINRKKHAFSDSVSNSSTCWYKEIEKVAGNKVSEDEWKNRFITYPHNTPTSKESFLYRKIFDNVVGKELHHLIPHFWMPLGVNEHVNPSATVLEGFSL